MKGDGGCPTGDSIREELRRRRVLDMTDTSRDEDLYGELRAVDLGTSGAMLIIGALLAAEMSSEIVVVVQEMLDEIDDRPDLREEIGRSFAEPPLTIQLSHPDDYFLFPSDVIRYIKPWEMMNMHPNNPKKGGGGGRRAHQSGRGRRKWR